MEKKNHLENVMKNKTLLYSSLVSFVVHLWLFSWVSAFPHPWLHYACIGTSIWNHGFTSDLAKWTDRAMITVCVGHNVYWLSMYNHYIGSWVGRLLTFHGVLFYFVSKMVVAQYQIRLHLLSHVCATCSNLFLGMVVAAASTATGSCH
jgi:hypothetical protein